MSGDGGFGRDSGTPKRRMLPAVTDVVRDLARTVSADPAVLFKTARLVVAEELARVKQGFESAPLDVLVRRAHRQLEQEGVATPAASPPEPEEPKSVSIPAPPLKPKKTADATDAPFQSAPAADLDWEKDLNIQPDDAPFRSAILPLPPKSRAPKGIAPPERTAAPAGPAPPLPVPSLPVPDRVLAPEGLAVGRSGTSEVPKAPVDDLPLFAAAEPALEPPVLAPPPPPPPPAPEPPPAREVRASVSEEPRVEPPPPAPRPPEMRLESPVKSEAEMPPRASVVPETAEPIEPEMQEFAFKAAEKPAPPPPKGGGRAGWIFAVALVLAVAAGLVWAVRTFLSGDVVKKVEVSTPAPKRREAVLVPATAAPAPVVAVPAPAKAASPKPTPSKATPSVPAAPIPRGKAALLLTPDWAGRPVVYVVHFSSHRDRPSAAKEAKRLAALFGKPGHAVEVDLGNKGVWYRVVIGEFATVEEARAYRADLEAKKTPDLGFVYEMRGR